jgi:hypothetical protein
MHLLFGTVSDVHITIPEGIEEITESCFSCTKLTAIRLPASLRRIGTMASADCKLLEEIDLPNSLEAIDYEGFMGCDTLRSVRLPSTIPIVP